MWLSWKQYTKRDRSLLAPFSNATVPSHGLSTTAHIAVHTNLPQRIQVHSQPYALRLADVKRKRALVATPVSLGKRRYRRLSLLLLQLTRQCRGRVHIGED